VLPRIRWGAVIAGALVAIAVEVVLGLFGAAIGIQADQRGSTGLAAVGVVWNLLVPLVAAFCGALVAARMASAVEEKASLLHGVLVWCVGLISGALFLTGILTTAARNAATIEANRSILVTSANQFSARSASGAALAALAGLLGLCGAILGAAVGRREMIEEQRYPRGRITTEEEMKREELEPPPPTHH
jgi:hypothetical protein